MRRRVVLREAAESGSFWFILIFFGVPIVAPALFWLLKNLFALMDAFRLWAGHYS